MDYKRATAALNSGSVPKQLSALIAVMPFLSSHPPDEDFMSSLSANGTDSDNNQTREAAFKCVQELYKERIFRWESIKMDVMKELGNADAVQPLRAAIGVLQLIPRSELFTFFGSAEGIASLKSCCTCSNLDIQATCVSLLSPLLVEVWILVEGGCLKADGMIKTECTADGKRFTQDFKDMCLELYKGFTAALLGKTNATISHLMLQHTGCITAYFAAVGHLLGYFNAGSKYVQKWVSALLGDVTNGNCVSKGVENRADKFASATLYPLLQIVLPKLCADPYLLLANWERVVRSGDHLSGGISSSMAKVQATVCMNAIFLAITNALPPTSDLDVCLISGLPPIMEFDSGVKNPMELIAAESDSSRQGNINNVHVVTLIREWTGVHLLGLLNSPYPDEVIEAVEGCLEITQHPALAFVRYQVCPLICSGLLRVMANFREAVVAGDVGVVANSSGFTGWFQPLQKAFIPMVWAASNNDNDGMEFTRLFEFCLQQCDAGCVPVYRDDDIFDRGSDRSLCPLGHGSRAAQFFHRGSNYLSDQLNSASYKHSYGSAARSQMHGDLSRAEPSPMAILCAYCMYALRFLPRLNTSGDVSVVSILITLVGFMRTSDLSLTVPDFSMEDTVGDGHGCVDYPGIHVVQTKLFAELAMLLLTDPSQRGSLSSMEFVKSFLNADPICKALTDANNDVKDMLVAALCRAYVRIQPAILLSMITKDEVLAETSPVEASGVSQDLISVTTNLPNPHASAQHVRGVGRWAEASSDIYSSEDRPALLQPTNSSAQASIGISDGQIDDDGGKGKRRIYKLEKLVQRSRAEFETLVHIGMLFMYSFSPCLTWSPTGAQCGDAAALQYLSMFFELSRVVYPIKTSRNGKIYMYSEFYEILNIRPCLLLGPVLPLPADARASMNKWGIEMLVERAEPLISMLCGEEVKSKTVRGQLLIVLAQTLSYQYENVHPLVMEKGSDLLDAIKKDLFQYEEKEAMTNKIMTSAMNKGLLGLTCLDAGSKGSGTANKSESSTDYHPSGNPCRQIQAIMTLELLALSNWGMQGHVVDTLKAFHKLFKVQSLTPVITVVPYYRGGSVDDPTKVSDRLNTDDITLRGQMAGWSAASIAVVQRSYLALQRVVAQAPNLASAAVKSADVFDMNSNIRTVTPSLTRGVTSGMMDVFSVTQINEESIFLSDDVETADPDKLVAYTSGSRVAELERSISDRNLSASQPSKSVFQWMSGIGSSPVCADVGLQHSYFQNRSRNINHSDSTHNVSHDIGGKYGCVADVVGLIDDVCNGHLIPAVASTDRESPKDALNKYLASVLLTSPDDIEYSAAVSSSSGKSSPWKVLSGSSDVLTVLGRCSIDSARCSGTLRCILINSSGVRIAPFAVEPVFFAGTIATAGSGCTVGASCIANTVSTQLAENYLPPGAYVEKSWNCLFHHNYTEHMVRFRITYNDLVPEDDVYGDPCFDLFSSSHYQKGHARFSREESAGTNKPPLNSRNSSFSSAGGGALAGGRLVSIAQVDSRPLVVKPMDLLVPYGGGSLTSMSQFTTSCSKDPNGTSGDFAFGVPLAVFRAMYSRLSVSVQKRVLPFRVYLNEGVTFLEAMRQSLKGLSTDGHDAAAVSAMMARVVMPNGSCSSEWGKRFHATLGWCFQSAFGQEVCMRLDAVASADSSNTDSCKNTKKVAWDCTLEIRSSCDLAARALIQNGMGTLKSLLGDLRIVLTANSSRVKSSSFKVPVLVSHVRQQKREEEDKLAMAERARQPSTGGFSSVAGGSGFAADPFGSKTTADPFATSSDPFAPPLASNSGGGKLDIFSAGGDPFAASDPFGGFGAPSVPAASTKAPSVVDVFSAFDDISTSEPVPTPTPAAVKPDLSNDILGLFSVPSTPAPFLGSSGVAAVGSVGSGFMTSNVDMSTTLGMLPVPAAVATAITIPPARAVHLPKSNTVDTTVSNNTGLSSLLQQMSLLTSSETDRAEGGVISPQAREQNYVQMRALNWRAEDVSIVQ